MCMPGRISKGDETCRDPTSIKRFAKMMGKPVIVIIVVTVIIIIIVVGVVVVAVAVVIVVKQRTNLKTEST